ncbi:MAG: aminotransferase class I/II-fold pyridoxal phosphate-dependent enzyme, partial [bacterium]
MGEQPLIDLSQNTSVMEPSRGAVEAAAREAAGANAYPERQSRALVTTLARFHEIDPNQIIVGNGAQHVLRIVAQTFLEPGDIAVGLSPTYPGYRNATAVMRAAYRSVPAANGGYNAAAWVEAARHARIAWLCTPN